MSHAKQAGSYRCWLKLRWYVASNEKPFSVASPRVRYGHTHPARRARAGSDNRR